MAHHLEGWTAIAFAEKHGGTLKKYRDPTERALKRVSIEKAKRVAREDPRLIYMDVPHGKWEKGNPRKRKRAHKLMRRGSKKLAAYVRSQSNRRRKKNPVRVGAQVVGSGTGWIKAKAVKVRKVKGKGYVVDVKR